MFAATSRRIIRRSSPSTTIAVWRCGPSVPLATSYVVIIDRNGRVAYTGDGADQNIPAELAKVLAR